MAIKIFADGANLAEIEELAADSRISGFTTNPTLMRKAGVKNYEAFCRGALELIGDKPISFEVFADDHEAMYRQAHTLAEWGENVYVKIPVTNSKGHNSLRVINSLNREGINVNVTAVFTAKQVAEIGRALNDSGYSAIISIFAGRIADTGRDPFHAMQHHVAGLAMLCPHVEVLWASPRQVLDVYEAERAGCHIITVTKAILDKMSLFVKDLEDYSLETVRMFHDDAKASGYKLAGAKVLMP